MAQLGIDFGTTNTVAVVHDRGILSEVQHTVDTSAGAVVQAMFPSAILIDRATGRRWFGIEADRRFGQRGPGGDHVFIPSLKRRLRDYVEGERTPLDSSGTPAACAGGSGDVATVDLAELLRDFLKDLADSIRRSQSLPPEEDLKAVITWPANANGAQRHVTRRCFREAGFTVTETLNEPTASAIELADCLTARQVRKQSREASAVAVFDLGGGTFDASVVWIDGDEFNVLASGGIEDLGGDDLDHLLLEMFLEALRVPADTIGGLTRHALLRQARAQKETISAGVVQRMFLNPMDFGIPRRPVSITVKAFFERVRPGLRRAIQTLEHVMDAAAEKEPRLSSGSGLVVYLVGGSSKLPLVAEMVSEAFPDNRVVLTDKPFRSVAMGAAIRAADRVRYRDVFARHFGLIRLRDHGMAEWFDPIFPAGTPLPRKGEPPLEKVARYHPRHNVGHLKYLECASIGADGMPDGNIRAWSDIRFPYDPSLALSSPVACDEIVATDEFTDQAVCEVYRCDSDGVITVEVHRPARQDARTYEIFRN
ncbi:MAG: Hsp70 family protein [Phycisphaerae bacterium]|nr:Hsp70 family protein [Phycisphaerae bacterium]